MTKVTNNITCISSVIILCFITLLIGSIYYCKFPSLYIFIWIVFAILAIIAADMDECET